MFGLGWTLCWVLIVEANGNQQVLVHLVNIIIENLLFKFIQQMLYLVLNNLRYTIY